MHINVVKNEVSAKMSSCGQMWLLNQLHFVS